MFGACFVVNLRASVRNFYFAWLFFHLDFNFARHVFTRVVFVLFRCEFGHFKMDGMAIINLFANFQNEIINM